MSFPREEGKLFKSVPRVCQRKSSMVHAFLNHSCLAHTVTVADPWAVKDSNSSLCHDLFQALLWGKIF